jgi:hypothetical protein
MIHHGEPLISSFPNSSISFHFPLGLRACYRLKRRPLAHSPHVSRAPTDPATARLLHEFEEALVLTGIVEVKESIFYVAGVNFQFEN